MKIVDDRFLSKKSFFYNDHGFTLIELMVSISIIAMVFVSVFRMQAGNIDLVESTKFYSMAPILAGQVFEKIGCTGHDLSIQDNTGNPEEYSGNLSNTYPGIIWKCRIMDVSSSLNEKLTKDPASWQVKSANIITETKGLKKIVVDIIHPDRTYEITTFRYVSF